MIRAVPPPSAGSGAPDPRKGGIAGTLIVSTVTTSIVVLPAFQLGSLGLFLRGDFGIDESVIGGVIAAFFLSSAVSAPASGRLADRIGAKRALLVGMLCSSMTLVGVSLALQVWHLIAMAVIGGVANGLVQPAANLALAGTRQRHRGLMFGIKQSGVPLATLVTGVTVPAVALSLGWRWAFGFSALLAVGVIVLVAVTTFDERAIAPDRAPPGRARVRPLVALTVAACFGIAAATALGAFTVESAVARGIDIALAGWLLAIGSVAGAVARLLVGWRADRIGANPVSLMILLLAVGVLGYVTLAMASGAAVILVGVVVGYAFGWGWNGLLMYSVVLIQPQAPAAASGIAQVGMSTGAALGPLGFGTIVSGGGDYSLAWGAAAGCAAIAALILLYIVRPQAREAMASPAGEDPSRSGSGAEPESTDI